MDRLSDVNHYYRDSMDGSTCEISRQWYEEAKDRLAAYEDLGAPEQLAARVEVVHCGECQWRYDATLEKDGIIPTMTCAHPKNQDEQFYYAVEGAHFCAWGERRED